MVGPGGLDLLAEGSGSGEHSVLEMGVISVTYVGSVEVLRDVIGLDITSPPPVGPMGPRSWLRPFIPFAR